MYYGRMEQLKKISFLSLEFPQFKDLLPLFAIYLKSKRNGIEEVLRKKYQELVEESNKLEQPMTIFNAIESYEFIDVRSYLLEVSENKIELEDRVTNSISGLGLHHKKLNIKDRDLMDFLDDRIGPFEPINPIRPNPIGNFRSRHTVVQDRGQWKRRWRKNMRRRLTRWLP